MKRTRLLLIALLLPLVGCAAPLVMYSPQGGNITYNGGVGTLAVTTRESRIFMASTFVYQSEGDPPTFTLSVTNTSRRAIDLDPVKFQAFVDNQEAHVYSLEERVQEIRTSASRKETALAVLGVAAAAAEAYDASHTTDTTTIRGVGAHGFFKATETTKSYDPGAGVLAGVSVLKDTGAGIKQIQNAAGAQEEAAMAIFQRTTLPPRATAVGQIVLKRPQAPFTQIRILVPSAGKSQEFVFVREKHKQ
jgi:hypothetical protein